MAGRIHRNQPGLGAIEHQMREQPFTSVGPRNNRNRRPKAAGTLSWRSRGSQTLTDLDAVPDIVLAAHRVNGNRTGHECVAQTLVMRIAASRKHDAPTSLYDNVLVAHAHARADNAARITNEIRKSRPKKNGHLAFA